MNTKQLKENHVINTMIREHEHILDMLEELEKISINLSDCDQSSAMKFMDRANELSIKIIGAEPHHKREEEVLFPAMAENGYSGPAECMKMEHEMMRKMKNSLIILPYSTGLCYPTFRLNCPRTAVYLY